MLTLLRLFSRQLDLFSGPQKVECSYVTQWLRIALSKGSTRFGAYLPEEGRTIAFETSFFLNFKWWTESKERRLFQRVTHYCLKDLRCCKSSLYIKYSISKCYRQLNPKHLSLSLSLSLHSIPACSTAANLICRSRTLLLTEWRKYASKQNNNVNNATVYSARPLSVRIKNNTQSASGAMDTIDTELNKPIDAVHRRLLLLLLLLW